MLCLSGDRDIKALKVKCDNLDNGCQWVGELRSLEEHEQNCDYALLPCTNECRIQNETVTVLRKDLDNHIAKECPRRQYKCPKCGNMGEYEERTTEHLNTCLHVIIQCPNDQCKAIIRRYMLLRHRSSCKYEEQPCKYAELGCKEKPFRKDLNQHEEDYQFHLQITTDSLLKYKKQLEQLKEVRHTKCNENFTFKLAAFKEKKSNNETSYSSPFYTSQNGYRLCINVDVNGNGDGKDTHTSVFANLMKGDNDESLTWPFTGTVTIELLNQVEDTNHYSRTFSFPADGSSSTRVTEGERGLGRGYNKFITHSKLQENYLVDDTLFFRVSVDVPNYKPWLECTRTD